MVPQIRLAQDPGGAATQAEQAVVLFDRSPANMTVPALIAEEGHLHRILSAGRRVSPDMAARLVAVTAALHQEGGVL